jgi:hypothetical protein
MSSRIGVVPTRLVATLTALAFALCLLGVYASAQTDIQPKDEIFGGYSWLHPGATRNSDYRVKDIVPGFDFSNVYYLPAAHNLGILGDVSGHFGDHVNVGYLLGGLQYKYHTDTFSPFVRVFVGAAKIDPSGLRNEWNPAVGGGGGFDLNVSHMFAIRLAQVDYIYSNYKGPFVGTSTQLNSIRLAAGVVINLGNYYAPALSCAATAQPTEVWSADPVKLNTTGTNFNPKHTPTYAWTVTGGKLDVNNAQAATVDTTGMAPGSYSASSTITNPKMRKMNSATCAASFTIKQPQAPVVSCSVSPTTIAIGESATVTMTATDPQGWPMTYSWSNSGGTLSGSGTDTSATVTATNADAGNTITVTGTATDPRANLNASCTANVNVPAVVKCTTIEDWGECTFEKNPKKPWRVDNDCKDTLDKLSLRLQQMPNGKVDIVGYTDEKEVVSEQTLGSQRSVNVKYYLTTDGPNKVDASRVTPRQGGTKGKATHFYFVPEGSLCGGQLEEGTTVDETAVQPQSRNAPAKRKAHHKAKPAAAPAQ